MNRDLRSRARIPYGYRIVKGAAVIDEEEAATLKAYYEKYLSGLPMTRAALEAQLHCSQTTLRNLLCKKEYVGTDYYPPIITKEYQDRLISEHERRKGQQIRVAPTHHEKGVRICREFRRVKMRIADTTDPVDYTAALFQSIRPKHDTATQASGK